MAKSKFSPEIRAYLEERANGRCEYCMASVLFSPHAFTIDHIIPLSAGGTDDLDNLAYACYICNCCKFNKLSALDPFLQIETSIFNPRTESWNNHFTWDASFLKILGITPAGRATVHALKLNRPELIRMRKELMAINRHPPE